MKRWDLIKGQRKTRMTTSVKEAEFKSPALPGSLVRSVFRHFSTACSISSRLALAPLSFWVLLLAIVFLLAAIFLESLQLD